LFVQGSYITSKKDPLLKNKTKNYLKKTKPKKDFLLESLNHDFSKIIIS